MRFSPLAVNGDKYPVSQVAMLPQACKGSLKQKFPLAIKSSFFGRGFFFSQGRYAISSALGLSQLKPGDGVLVPAYHCRSLVEPVLFIGCKPIFYPLKDDLHFDYTTLGRIVNASEHSVKAMVLTHYFGFPQDCNSAVKFCKENNLILIEDCAHAFYGEVQGRALGSYGDFSIASPRKFFPIQDGGILIAKQENAPVKVEKMPLVNELKAISRFISACFMKDKKDKLSSEKLVNLSITETKILQGESNSSVFQCFSEEQSKKAGLRFSKWMISKFDHHNIVDSRRTNFLLWLDGISGVKGCRPLMQTLEGGVVPYVFPLVIDSNVELVFNELKCWGVPIWRWEDMAKSNCRVTKKYRLSLLQLPCHQGLSEAALNWMIKIVKQVVINSNKRDV